MAKYWIKEAAYVGSGHTARYFPALSTIVVPDDTQPSRRWMPLDEAAQQALAKLGVNMEIGTVEEPTTPPEPPDTMYETQVPPHKRKGRAADRT